MRSYNTALDVMSYATPFIRFLPNGRIIVAAVAAVFSMLGILVIHPASLAHFGVYLVVWCTFIHIFHRDLTKDFILAFLVNSAFIVVFYWIQINVYPDSYGTTSPLSSSWTDDSYFFTLIADSVPPNLDTRDNYFLYNHPFSTLVRTLTPFSIIHPMDVIFFQSGIAALLATFTKSFILQLSNNLRLGKSVYIFIIVCPFLMMNGGVIFIRDTFVAALFIYSLSCINSGRMMLAVASVFLQFLVRPGTALLLIPAYIIIYWKDLFGSSVRAWGKVVALLVIAVFGLIIFQFELQEILEGTSEGGALNFIGRELIVSYINDSEKNLLFLKIQELPYIIKLFFSGAYIFTYPFLTPKYAFEGHNFDVRSIIMNFMVPIQGLWLNAWFVAGTLARNTIIKKQIEIVVAMVVILILIGVYSLQTRHKTIIYPLYYFIIAIGFVTATPGQRAFGYLCSSVLLLLQLIFIFR